MDPEIEKITMRYSLLLLGALALLLLLLLLWLPSRGGRVSQSSICLDWLEPCADWETCPPLTNQTRSVPAGQVCAGAARPLGQSLPLPSDGGALSSYARDVLIVHEQHPQPLGCDRRLLSLIKLLQAEGRRVSLLYRRDVPPSEQSPPTAQLAHELGIAPFAPNELGSCLRPPPALYRYAAPRQVERLMQRGWFGLILVTVWFWNDPCASPPRLRRARSDAARPCPRRTTSPPCRPATRGLTTLAVSPLPQATFIRRARAADSTCPLATPSALGASQRRPCRHPGPCSAAAIRGAACG